MESVAIVEEKEKKSEEKKEKSGRGGGREEVGAGQFQGSVGWGVIYQGSLERNYIKATAGKTEHFTPPAGYIVS